MSFTREASLRARASNHSPLINCRAWVGVVVLCRSEVLVKPAGMSSVANRSSGRLRRFLM
jgi:hypothetical protein